LAPRETSERLGHAERRRPSREDVRPPPVQLDAGVLEIHGRDRRDPHRGGAGAGLAAREPVPSRVEGGTGDEHVGLLLAKRGLHLGAERLEIGGRAVVAADEGRDDAAGIAELLLKTDARADGALAHREREVAGLLAADATEKLVQVLDDAKLGQGITLSWLIP